MRVSFGSVCSGIEAASVAWHPLGWETVWLAEIEKAPAAVLRHHYPQTFNFGGMTSIAPLVRAGLVTPPDVLVGGTPCQAFSVAGLRNSLSDKRGQLSLAFVDLANAIDERRNEGCVIVWENVPGVLSTKDNAFGCFLAALAGEDEALVPSGSRWPNAGCVYGPARTVAWRVLDAQYFGVAQRRRRVFVVASARDDFDPATVLFESEGMRRNTPPGREERQALHPCITARGGEALDDTSAYVLAGGRVRRLTVVECERLQGFPDDYTLVPHRGKPMADGPRYKALGNSMAVPCMTWLGRRIDAALRRAHNAPK